MRVFEQNNIEKNRLVFSLIVLSAWTVFGVFFGAQNYIRDVYVGKGASLPGYIVGWLICGYSWAILTVPVMRFVRRYSVEALGWSRFFLVQIPAAILFALVQLGIYVAIAVTLFGSGGHGYWEFYKFTAVQEFQSSFLVYFAIISAVTAYDRWFGPKPDAQEHTDLVAKPVTRPFLRRIPVKENGRIVLVDTDNIEWVESYGNYVFLHTSERRHIFRVTMSAMETKLDPTQFVRIRRSAIVRKAQIREFRPVINGEFDIILKAGTVLTSTRRYRKNLESIMRP